MKKNIKHETIEEYVNPKDIHNMCDKYPREEGYYFAQSIDSKLALYRKRLETDDEFLKRALREFSSLKSHAISKIEKKIVAAYNKGVKISPEINDLYQRLLSEEERSEKEIIKLVEEMHDLE